MAAFLDVASAAGGPEFQFEEIEVTDTSNRAGSSIRDLRVREQTGAMIIGLRKQDGTFDTTPSPDSVFDVGDVMIGVGTPEELQALEELFAPSGAVGG